MRDRNVQLHEVDGSGMHTTGLDTFETVVGSGKVNEDHNEQTSYRGECLFKAGGFGSVIAAYVTCVDSKVI